jgi:Tc toxin complex TcA C-terminal TcB-binding domain
MELKNVDRQIVSQQVRVDTARQELDNQQKQLDQVTQVEDFLRNKYTNEELCSWMEGMTKTLYRQAYNLAFDLAKRAEKAFNFERPQSISQFIQIGYWNNARDGLLAGEQLYLGLKQLEAAYQENLGHDFEASKMVSVRQWAPLALVEFRETGVFELELPEIVFDMDYPGHYLHRITSVTVTIPCVIGPYTTINCTLRLLQHTIRTKPRATSKSDYPRSTEDGQDDDGFSTMNVPISAVVLSSAQNDMGRHEASLSDRYNPFEGAGVISRWRFELPSKFRQFNYSAITDVIMYVKYTSLDGGDKLKTIAAETVVDYVKALEAESQGIGIFAFFDLKSDFATEWYASLNQLNSGSTPLREMSLNNLSERLPIFTRAAQPNKIVVTSLALLGRGSTLSPGEAKATLQQPGGGGQEADFQPGGLDIELKELTAITSKGLQMPMTSWKLSLTGASASVEGLWLVVKYSLLG